MRMSVTVREMSIAPGNGNMYKGLGASSSCFNLSKFPARNALRVASLETLKVGIRNSDTSDP